VRAEARTRRRRLSRLAAAVLGTAMLVLLVRLGFWQLERAEFKERLAQRYAVHADAAARPVHELLAQGAQPARWQYRRARAEGRFDTRRQYLLDNRTRTGRAGYHVLTPLDTARETLLVNRGWVALGPDRGALPPLELSPGPLTVTGRLAPPPQPGLLLGASGYDAASWPKVVQLVDLEQMSRQLGAPLLPAVLLLDPSHEACLVCEWQPARGIGAERHRGYAVQWFALAAALAALLGIAAWKGRAGDER